MSRLDGYLILGASAAATTLIATPIVRRLAERSGRVTQPDARRVHSRATASVGGVAMLFGLLVAMALAVSVAPGGVGVSANRFEAAGVAVSAVMICMVGLLDDLRKSNPARPGSEGLSPPAKLTGMVVAGFALAFAGVTLWHFRVPFWRVVVLPSDLRPIVTVVWLIVMANAINFIDGLDGLAAGIVAIADRGILRVQLPPRIRSSVVRQSVSWPARSSHRMWGVPRLPTVQRASGKDFHG